ncbi:YihY/virulence factor BrkB family protein [Bradyrhizobium sp.]|uniref:YihY/virulence factor BrkB family protein n=1 Tax=Bradyrhizobium sp. TaxID=376 RepID=UPI002D39AE22|nr:YihY/virulence factor BrkB family protein [Bradyrhizobium sp.]HZR77041.1 YihY/virulence factor BrkB family protein [Bradyrhizobium sp.]
MRKPEPVDMPRWLAGLALAGLVAAAWRREARPAPAKSRRGGAESLAAVASPGLVPAAAHDPRSWDAWKEFLWRVYQAMADNRLMAVAAGVVYFALLALFPAITAFVSLYGLFSDPVRVGKHLSLLAGILPGGAFDIVGGQITRIASIGSGHLSLGFVFGLGLSLWSANAGMKAMMDALNVIYGTRETRNFIKLNLVSLLLTAGAMALMLLLVGAVIVFPLALNYAGFGGWSDSVMPYLRWPVIFVAVLVALAVLYRFGPSPYRARFRWITPGSIFATAAWMIGSGLLSWYLANFANYDATYGSLGAAIGLMVWMWMSAVVVLLGAEINALLEKWPAKPQRHYLEPERQSAAAQP